MDADRDSGKIRRLTNLSCPVIARRYQTVAFMQFRCGLICGVGVRVAIKVWRSRSMPTMGCYGSARRGDVEVCDWR